jgi:hypothetical protein
MNLKIIACKVLWRELSLLTATSRHYCDATFISQGLHARPEGLRGILQAEIDAVESGGDIRTGYPPCGRPFDAILLGYALCSGSAEGLRSSRIPLVLPRAHDCVALLLGSRERYGELFFARSGTFWNSVGWSECGFMPDREHRDAAYAKFLEKRGAAAADRLIRADERWKEGYSRLAYIEWEALRDERCEGRCRRCAEYNGWAFEILRGDSGLLRRFVGGEWGDGEFLVAPPGRAVVQTYDERIVDHAK